MTGKKGRRMRQEKKRVFSWLMMLAMVFSFILPGNQLNVQAEDILTVNADGYYELGSADDMLAFAQKVNAGERLGLLLQNMQVLLMVRIIRSRILLLTQRIKIKVFLEPISERLRILLILPELIRKIMRISGDLQQLIKEKLLIVIVV